MVEVRNGWVVFQFFRPRAGQVDLVGDFNGWRTGQLPMQRDEGGYWTAALRLPPGSYRFLYCADGRWFCDFAAFGVEHGPFGPDGVVHVAQGPDAGQDSRQSGSVTPGEPDPEAPDSAERSRYTNDV